MFLMFLHTKNMINPMHRSRDISEMTEREYPYYIVNREVDWTEIYRDCSLEYYAFHFQKLQKTSS